MENRVRETAAIVALETVRDVGYGRSKGKRTDRTMKFVTLVCIFFLGGLSNTLTNTDVGYYASQPAASGDRKSTEMMERLIAKRQEFRVRHQLQIENYRNGTALMIGISITNYGASDHEGTALCEAIGKSVGNEKKVPELDCKKGSNWDEKSLGKQRSDPWPRKRSRRIVTRTLGYFHMIAWEYHDFPVHGSLEKTHWSMPEVLSVILMRHPMSRILSAPGVRSLGDYDDGQWSEFLEMKRNDNLLLRTLATDKRCCDGADTPPHFLSSAKKLLEYFTYVLDAKCLEEGMKRLAEDLGIRINPTREKLTTYHDADALLEEEIKNPERYRELLQKNGPDIELYEWSKSIALVNCTYP